MMEPRYQLAYVLYPYKRSADQDCDQPQRHAVVVVGGGPVGIGLALDLVRQGVPALVLDDHEGIGIGSKAICFSKRTLEIANRYGFGKKLIEKGVVWNLGKVFHEDHQVFEFNLLPEEGHEAPAFINLQQSYFEKFQYEQLEIEQAQGAPIEVRGRNKLIAVTQHADHAELTIDTPDGPYILLADWVVGCDGAHSPLRRAMGLEFEGRVFQDSFLIVDIRMKADYPTERWFWFEPSFKSGASALLHKEPDDVWRIDFQIGWDVDREEALKPENIHARLAAMLGADVEYDLVWSSVYTFQCKRMTDFVHNRIIFAGDAAHQVSPFGARGLNSGMQDVDNLGWKLGQVVQGKAPATLIGSYQTERVFAADENIRHSTQATDFISPKSQMSYVFRNAVLQLAESYEFARPLVNSGRLSLPASYVDSVLNGPDLITCGPACTKVGSPCPDAPLENGFLLSQLGDEFVVLTVNLESTPTLPIFGLPVRHVAIQTGVQQLDVFADRYLGGASQAVYLIRPDQHVAARWEQYDETALRNAIRQAIGKD